MFQGDPQLAAPYFESLGFAGAATENPADYCLDVISGCLERPTGEGVEEEDLVAAGLRGGQAWVRGERGCYCD